MSPPSRSRWAWVLVSFGLIAGFFLLSEHRAHALGVLPYLLLLACPLLHMFSHGSHAGDDGHAAHWHRRGGDAS
jgi:hypothetical protein